MKQGTIDQQKLQQQRDLLPGFPLSAGQTEPDVLCTDGLRHVAPHYVLVHLALDNKKSNDPTTTTTVGQSLQNLTTGNRRMKPPAQWWMNQLNRGRLFADKALKELVHEDKVVEIGDCTLWSTFHYHEQAIHYNPSSSSSSDMILYSDENYIVVNKPAGVDVLCNPAAGRVRNSLPGLYAAYTAATTNHQSLLLPAHRLDSPVSGLVCCGRTNSDVKRLSRRIELGETNKRYIARVCVASTSSNNDWSLLQQLPLTIDQAVAFDSSKSLAYIDHVKGKRAVTIIERCLYENHKDGTAIVVIQIQTGRKHQIRVHLQSCGMPIANDERYGGGTSNHQQPQLSSAFGMPHPPQALQTFYQNHFDESCDDCMFVRDLLSGKRGLGPSVNQGIWLHCFRYEFQTLGLAFESPLPSWAVVPK